MKYYKKFYEIDSNRYSTIIADDEMFIATESFIKTGKKKLFRKEKELTTGFKILKVSPAIMKLFLALNDVELVDNRKQRYDSEDLLIYKHIDNKKLKEDIKNSYLEVYKEEIENTIKQRDELLRKGRENDAKICENYIKRLNNLELMSGIDLEKPVHSGCMIIKTMLREGLEHLYTEKVNAFAKNVYLYEQDEFGTLTIYKLITVKNIVKTIDTFIYDKKLIENLLNNLYEEGE